MDSYRLPFALDVEMKTYHCTAFPLGILKANLANYDGWLCNKLIQIVNNNRINQFECVEDDLWAVSDEALIRQTMWLSPKAFCQKGIDIVAFNKEMIKNDNYVTGNFNEFYIPGKRSYKEFDFSHDYIIFGFDDRKKVFKSAGYMSDGHYRYFDIYYDDYLKGVSENRIPLGELLFYKINHNFSSTINIEVIKRKLKSYLGSYCDSQLYNSKTGDLYYGINAWNQLIGYVRSHQKYDLDLRFGRLFMEHRNVMYKRLKILFDGYPHSNNVGLLNQYYTRVCKRAMIVYALFIKFNLTHHSAIVTRIVENIEAVNREEEELLLNVIDQI